MRTSGLERLPLTCEESQDEQAPQNLMRGDDRVEKRQSEKYRFSVASGQV